MLPERYQGVPCANVRANSSKMRRSAAQPSHLNSSLHPAPPRKPKASPPVIAEWHQPLSAAACSLTRLLLHTKPALAAVLRVVSSAFHAQRCHCTEPCRSPRLGPLMYAGRPQSSTCRPHPSRNQFRRSSMAVKLSAAAHHPCANVRESGLCERAHRWPLRG